MKLINECWVMIPARSGSKTIKNKNIKKINNLPLIKYVFLNVLNSKKIHNFYLASDKKNIYEKLGNLKKKILFFKRS